MSREFTYTAEQLRAVESTLSAERLGEYLRRADGNAERAVRLYEDNTALSEAMYGVLQGFEVPLRNAMHFTIVGAIGKEDWYDRLTFRPLEAKHIQKAKDSILHSGNSVTSGRMVAELTFGFWVALVTKHYVNELWIPYLHRAFRHKRIGRGAAHQRLDEIRSLRNQVAHHQCILHRDLEDDYIKILGTLAWICPATAQRVRETTRFEQRFKERCGRAIIVPCPL
jgi:hypothetical protein